MGIFDFLRKKKQPADTVVQPLSIKGPLYLREHLTTLEDGLKLPAYRLPENRCWTGQLISSGKGRLFELHYYGRCGNDQISCAGDGTLKLVAVSLNDGEEIVVFDNTVHGWDGFISNSYAAQKVYERKACNKFLSTDQMLKFRVVVRVGYNHGTETELTSEAAGGKITLADGSVVALQDAFDNAFDVLAIYVIDEKERVFEIISAELA